MAEMSEILPFCERTWSTMRDGDYISVRHGQSRSRASVVVRYGPDGRAEDEEQEELDELFGSPERMSEDLADEIKALGEEDPSTVWVEAFHRGSKRPHERVVIDSWPDSELSREGKRRHRSLERMAGADPGGAAVLALSRAFESRTMQIEGLVQAVLRSLDSARAAQYREVEAARQAAIAELDARAASALGDAEDRSRRDERNHQLLLQLVQHAGPAFAPLLASFAPGAPAQAQPQPQKDQGDPGADPEQADTPDGAADRLVADFRALILRDGGPQAVMARQSELMELARSAALRAAGGAA